MVEIRKIKSRQITVFSENYCIQLYNYNDLRILFKKKRSLDILFLLAKSYFTETSYLYPISSNPLGNIFK